MGTRRGAGWLEQWKAEEPLRLYLWTVAGAVLMGGVTTGLLTETWAVAIGGVAAAVLMMGGTAAARAKAWAPATVERTLQQQLDAQHADSYSRGYRAALEANDTPGPDHAAAELLAKAQKVLRADVIEAERERFTPADLATQPRSALPACNHMEYGVRCTLPKHPDTFPHRLEK